VEAAKAKNSEIEEKRAELEALNQKYTDLELELQQKQQNQQSAEATILKNQEKSLQRIAELKSQLQAERRTKNEAVAKAKIESDKLRDQIADIRFEMQESGGNFDGNTTVGKSPALLSMTPERSQGARNITPSTPEPTPTVKKNNENVYPIPLSGQKTIRSLPQGPRNIIPTTPERTPNSKKNIENVYPVSLSGQKTIRSLVKEAGGRNGLRKKLQQLRSPRGAHQQAVTFM
jgi:hypothetical protein